MIDHDAGDPDGLALRELRRDPEHEALAREHMATILTTDVLRFLREAATWAPAPTWLPRIVRELPRLADWGALRDPTQREAIAQVMVDLGSVDEEEARSDLLASYRRAEAQLAPRPAE